MTHQALTEHEALGNQALGVEAGGDFLTFWGAFPDDHPGCTSIFVRL